MGQPQFLSVTSPKIWYEQCGCCHVTSVATTASTTGKQPLAGIKAGKLIIAVPTALPGVNSRLKDAKNEQAKIVEVGPFFPWVYIHMKQITAVGLVGLMS